MFNGFQTIRKPDGSQITAVMKRFFSDKFQSVRKNDFFDRCIALKCRIYDNADSIRNDSTGSRSGVCCQNMVCYFKSDCIGDFLMIQI